MEKPDNVAEKPNLLPYGSNVGAPSIRIENIQFWKETKVNKVNHLFDEKFNSIKKDYEKLLEEYEWNNLVYKSNFNFEPTIGQTYYLYIILYIYIFYTYLFILIYFDMINHFTNTNYVLIFFF